MPCYAMLCQLPRVRPLPCGGPEAPPVRQGRLRSRRRRTSPGPCLPPSRQPAPPALRARAPPLGERSGGPTMHRRRRRRRRPRHRLPQTHRRLRAQKDRSRWRRRRQRPTRRGSRFRASMSAGDRSSLLAPSVGVRPTPGLSRAPPPRRLPLQTVRPRRRQPSTLEGSHRLPRRFNSRRSWERRQRVSTPRRSCALAWELGASA